MLTINELRDRYREAWLVARRVPSGMNLGHASYWPEFNPNRWEVYHSEDARIKPAPLLRMPWTGWWSACAGCDGSARRSESWSGSVLADCPGVISLKSQGCLE